MEVLPGVHIVEGVPGGRVYVIEDGSRLTVVDSGITGGAWRILRYLRAHGLDPSGVERVLLTHGHPDHIGGAAALRRATGAAVLAHEAECLTSAHRAVRCRTVAVPAMVDRALGWAVRVDGTLADGQALPVRGGLRVIHLPGHTPGSVGYLIERDGLLFTGDTLLSNGKRFSRPLTFRGSNEADYRASLDRLGSVSFTSAFPGHGTPLLKEGGEALRSLLESYPSYSPWRVAFQRMLGDHRP